jgi:hypothetical protein
MTDKVLTAHASLAAASFCAGLLFAFLRAFCKTVRWPSYGPDALGDALPASLAWEIFTFLFSN